MRILIVDDDQAITEQIKSTLSSAMDCEIDIAYDGKAALEKLKRDGPFDLLILAILIPRLSGTEVCQAMIYDEKLKHIPVLLVSVLPLYSDAFRKSLEKFDELSVVKALLEKPFSREDLLTKVKAIVGR